MAVVTPPSSHLEWTLAPRGWQGRDTREAASSPVADFDLIERMRSARGRLVYVAENYYYKPVLGAVRGALKSAPSASRCSST